MDTLRWQRLSCTAILAMDDGLLPRIRRGVQDFQRGTMVRQTLLHAGVVQ